MRPIKLAYVPFDIRHFSPESVYLIQDPVKGLFVFKFGKFKGLWIMSGVRLA